MLRWTNVSPGIWVTDHEGYRITKIEVGKTYTGRITGAGVREQEPIYNYVAIKPGPPEPVRFAGVSLDNILNKIAATLQASLF